MQLLEAMQRLRRKTQGEPNAQKGSCDCVGLSGRSCQYQVCLQYRHGQRRSHGGLGLRRLRCDVDRGVITARLRDASTRRPRKERFFLHASVVFASACGARSALMTDVGNNDGAVLDVMSRADRGRVDVSAEGSTDASTGDSTTTRLNPPGDDASDGAVHPTMDGALFLDARPLFDASCSADAAGSVVDAGLLANCTEDPCGTGQYCANFLDGVIVDARCIELPPQCLCVHTCECLEVWSVRRNIASCMSTSPGLVLTYGQPPPAR